MFDPRPILREFMMKNIYRKTIFSCFVGYVVQAIVNTFVPLLFLTFQSEYGIPLSQITLLITVNFCLQLFIDFVSAFLIDRLGYRICAVSAHVFAAVGLILLTVLPEALPDPFVGLLISVLLYAIGGGLLEVVVSPIVEACPSEHKEKTMSLLHSFYCWGSVGVAAVSALFFFGFGIGNWKILALVWAVVPLVNAVCFAFVPLKKLIEEGETSLSVPQLLKNKMFWLFAVLMLCAGASEAAIVQWSSAFVESNLGLSKSVGDLVGPALFAAMMGISRMIYGKFGEKLDLDKMMLFSGMLCVVSYLVMALVPHPAIALVGMAVSGFSVGIMWPGTFSTASATVKGGGNAMFALLALAGDFGCASGPAVVGFFSDLFQGNMRIGILFALFFPALLTVAMLIKPKRKHN